MSENDKHAAQGEVDDLDDRLQAAGARHAAMRRAAAPTGTAEAAARSFEAMFAMPPSITPEKRAELLALRSLLRHAAQTEYGHQTAAEFALALLRRARAAEVIVAGRETEPTHEEFLAQEVAGGGWLVAYVTPHTKPGHQAMKVLANYADVRWWLENRRWGDKVVRWWSLGTNGAPGAWPVPQGNEVEVLTQRMESAR